MHYSASPVPEHFQTIERAFLSHTKSMHFSPDGFLTAQKTHLTESQLFCSRPHSGGGQRVRGRVGGGGEDTTQANSFWAIYLQDRRTLINPDSSMVFDFCGRQRRRWTQFSAAQKLSRQIGGAPRETDTRDAQRLHQARDACLHATCSAGTRLYEQDNFLNLRF